MDKFKNKIFVRHEKDGKKKYIQKAHCNGIGWQKTIQRQRDM